jgi:phage baseplate assembly protein W
MSTYRGFSTLQNYKTYTLTDFQLAQQDLINYFSIKKGQKLMQPNFGSDIWATLFEPLDETTQAIITADINKIVNYDPRLAVTQINVTQQNNGFLIQMNITYIPTDETAEILLNFDRNSQTLTTGASNPITGALIS